MFPYTCITIKRTMLKSVIHESPLIRSKGECCLKSRISVLLYSKGNYSWNPLRQSQWSDHIPSLNIRAIFERPKQSNSVKLHLNKETNAFVRPFHNSTNCGLKSGSSTLCAFKSTLTLLYDIFMTNISLLKHFMKAFWLLTNWEGISV